MEDQLQALIGREVRLWINDDCIDGTLHTAYADYRIDVLWNTNVCILFAAVTVDRIQINQRDIPHIVIKRNVNCKPC